MAQAILWILDHKRQTFSNPIFHVIYRAEVVSKARVNHQNFSDFIKKLSEASLIRTIPSYDDENAWWAFVVTPAGEAQLRDELKSY
jgi:23S rRNA maturation-related 3'-5' exoribonuclease YhaM